ncbi:hypothetical protein BC833DRAFT_601658, partial [Globomyces pollinis-pini]
MIQLTIPITLTLIANAVSILLLLLSLTLQFLKRKIESVTASNLAVQCSLLTYHILRIIYTFLTESVYQANGSLEQQERYGMYPHHFFEVALTVATFSIVFVYLSICFSLISAMTNSFQLIKRTVDYLTHYPKFFGQLNGMLVALLLVESIILLALFSNDPTRLRVWRDNVFTIQQLLFALPMLLMVVNLIYSLRFYCKLKGQSLFGDKVSFGMVRLIIIGFLGVLFMCLDPNFNYYPDAFSSSSMSRNNSALPAVKTTTGLSAIFGMLGGAYSALYLCKYYQLNNKKPTESVGHNLKTEMKGRPQSQLVASKSTNQLEEKN